MAAGCRWRLTALAVASMVKRLKPYRLASIRSTRELLTCVGTSNEEIATLSAVDMAQEKRRPLRL